MINAMQCVKYATDNADLFGILLGRSIGFVFILALVWRACCLFVDAFIGLVDVIAARIAKHCPECAEKISHNDFYAQK